MSSLLAGTDSLICARLGIKERRHLGHLTRRIEPLSDSAALDLVEALYRRRPPSLSHSRPGRFRRQHPQGQHPPASIGTCRMQPLVPESSRPPSFRNNRAFRSILSGTFALAKAASFSSNEPGVDRPLPRIHAHLLALVGAEAAAGVSKRCCRGVGQVLTGCGGGQTIGVSGAPRG